MQVQQVMTQDPACCTPNTKLQSIACMMIDNNCGAIPVVDNPTTKRLLGIVTDRDIVCREVARGKNPLEFTADDCMTRSPATVSPQTDLEECCRLIEQKQVRRIPVVDASGCCCGIVSQADIAVGGDERTAAEVVREISA